MPAWVGPLVVASVALVLYLGRREAAALQANIAGGTIRPGCVTGQAVALLAVAILMWLATSR